MKESQVTFIYRDANGDIDEPLSSLASASYLFKDMMRELLQGGWQLHHTTADSFYFDACNGRDGWVEIFILDKSGKRIAITEF